ncbi:MAG: hypothetical protein U9R79_22815 [Armatimonadota bacterium]|nr:hypothetical protein [Armatimonadota bacterium]
MRVCDFSRSFATFVTPGRGNLARIQVEAVCELSARLGGGRFVLVASCKAEATYAADDLFRLPNYDFCAIFGEDEFCIVRVHLPVQEDWRETGLIRDRFEDVMIDVVDAPADACEGPDEIVEATLANRPLVGRTELLDDDGQPLASLDYPVKTMNVNDERVAYQVDTGPVLVPDAERDVDLTVERLDLAFIAWNRPDRAELIVLAPTETAQQSHAGECRMQVAHYSRVRKVAARNQVLAVR